MTVEPVTHVSLTLGEAANALTGFEAIAIEERFRTPMDKLSGVKLLVGLVWAHRRRGAADRKSAVNWPDVEAMSLQELQEFFDEEPDGLDEDAEGNADAA